MMRVDFQIIYSFDKKTDLKKELLGLLKETSDNSAINLIEIEDKPENIEEWSIFDYIEIKYNYPSNNKYIAGFSLDFEGINNEFINEFGQTLEDDTAIDLVIKYKDEIMQEEHQKYAREIFELEMKLREVLTFIFLGAYGEPYYSFLNYQKVNGKGLKKDTKEKTLTTNLENEFFYLSFSQYRELTLPNIILSEKILKIINEKNNNKYVPNETLRDRLLKLGVFTNRGRYEDFIAAIKDNLTSIENLRNCIAHNRSLPDYNEIKSYETARDKLEALIKDFWESIKDNTH